MIMDQEINGNEVLSESSLFSPTRPSSSASSDMPKVNLRSRRNSCLKHQPSNIDVTDVSPLETKHSSPIKVLVVNGKCSEIFKSTLEECVEDCILEFPAEQNSIYVSKTGQTTQLPAGSHRHSITSIREQSASTRLSARSNRRRNSINQYHSQPQIGSARTSGTNNLTLPSVALAASTSARIRHQHIQQKLSLVEDISEEQTNMTQSPMTPNIEHGIIQAEYRSFLHDESISPIPHPDSASNKRRVSYRDRQKDYRLSDLVMLGPEYFTEVFNLPRDQSRLQQQQQQNTSTSELDRIKQDLFHRYLWTQKPQVSCRIRPLSTYSRSTTLVL